MANKTTNYDLVKPLPNEYYDVAIQNDNMDIIDDELKKLEDNKVDNLKVLTDVPAGAKFTDTTYTKATISKDGLMAKEDKEKLDGVEEGANNYKHPTSAGNKHIPSGGSANQILRYNSSGTAVWSDENDTTYPKATTTKDGLMSKEDKSKLNDIDDGANKIIVNNTLTSTNTTQALSARQGKQLKDDLVVVENDLVTLDNKVKTHEADNAKHLQVGERESWNNLTKVKKNITILATGWVDDTLASGFWIYEITGADITVDTVVDINIHLTDLEKATNIKSSNLSSLGKVTLYADKQIIEDIVCDIKLIKEVM